MKEFCLVCTDEIDIKNKKGGQIYDTECTLRYLCPRCDKIWNKHTEDKVDGELIFKNKSYFSEYINYIRKLLAKDALVSNSEVKDGK